jgi:predicted transcriptional regulator
MTPSYEEGARMKSAVTIRLDPDLEKQLDEVVRESGRSRSEIIRDALRRELLRRQFEQLRERVMPFAEARGLLTDEDIFRQIS